MNRVMLGLLLAVCLLGAALIMLNERLSEETEFHAVQQHISPNEIETPQIDNKPSTWERQSVKQPNFEPARQIPLAGIKEESMSATQQTPQYPPVNAKPSLDELDKLLDNLYAEHSASKEEKPAKKAPVAQAKESVKKSPPPQPAKPQTQRSNEKQVTPNTKKSTPEPTKPVKKQEEPVSTAPTVPNISRFVVFSRDKGATVRLVGTAPLHYFTMQLHDPERLVLDLDGDVDIKAPGIPENPMISNVRIGKLQDKNKTRIVFDLKEAPRKSKVLPGNGGNSVDLRLDQ